MRSAFVIVVLAGCYAALPPPVPPAIRGVVDASGGALGTWRISPTLGKPIETSGVEGLDLVDPSSPGHIVRLVRTTADSGLLPRGITEVMASRGVEVRLASSDSKTEVVLDPSSCTTLEAIFRFAYGHAFGSARFDCDLGAAGHARGDVEFAAGSTSGMKTTSGHIEASDTTLAGVRFEPDEAEVDRRGVVFWDHRHPRVVFELDRLPPDPSVLGAGSNATLRVISTSARVASFEVAPSSCGVLRYGAEESGYVRVGTRQHTMWSGNVEIDCTTPTGGRLTAKLEVR
jgi:hypothetical protein